MSALATDGDAPHPEGYIGRIPVRNLWLLMLYASELFRTRGTGKVGQEESPDELPDLVAEILAESVTARLRQRLGVAFHQREGVLHRIRGRVDLLKTERHQLLATGRVACRYDELTIDTPRHRLVRAALVSVAKLVKQPDLAHRCRVLASVLQRMGVSGTAPPRSQIDAERFGRHDVADQQMLAAAKLAFDLVLPTESSGSHALPLPDRDVHWVRQLFEKAVGGFYRVVLRPQGWQVKCGGVLNWPIDQQTAGIARILPSMRTDIVLDHVPTHRRIVIDTKFTNVLTKGWYRDETLRSGYIYQIYAYLRSQAGRGDPLADSACGLLLHPAVGEDVDETVVIQGHPIRFATVDLAREPTQMRAELLRLVGEWDVESAR